MDKNEADKLRQAYQKEKNILVVERMLVAHMRLACEDSIADIAERMMRSP